MRKQTFILEVCDTQYGSWQGKLDWVQKQKSQTYRSALELLGLIESALREEGRVPGAEKNTVSIEKKIV